MRLSKLPGIEADPDKFKQVIVNILLNSIDAMPEGGDLFVSSGIMRNEADGSDHASFQFKDTGTGMTTEVLDHVFEPFFTTKAEGVGLGLAICKTIIEEHGGSIDVMSSSDSDQPGTVVTITFPINSMKSI